MSSGGYWQIGKTLSQSNKHMLECKLGVDACFRVGDSDSVEIHAHKFMLVSRSPVFEAMFYGAMADHSEIIEIPDVHPRAFQNLLEFMYTDHCTLDDVDIAIQTLYASKKYMITHLTAKSIECILDNIGVANVCYILEQCTLLDENQLVEKCRSYIQRHASEIVNEVSLVSLSDFTLKSILEDDKLIVLEFDLLNALVEWADESLPCNEPDATEWIKVKLQPFLNLIRFALIPYKQLATLNAMYKLLSASELHQIHLFQTGGLKDSALPYSNDIRGCRQSTRFKVMEDFDVSTLVRKEEKVKRKFMLEFRSSFETLTLFAVSVMCGPYLVKIVVFDPEGHLVSFTERDYSNWDEKDCCREMTIVLAEPVVCGVSEECMRIEVYLSNSNVMYWYDNVITGKPTENKYLKLKVMNPEIISRIHYLVG